MHQAFLGVEPATLEWREIENNGDKHFAPYSPIFDDIYFNTLSGIAESEYVFIKGNQLKERFASKPDSFSIFETGFGTGLNFLLTAQLWQRLNPDGHLNFYSVEQFPIQADDLKRIYHELKLDTEISTILLEQYPPIIPGVFPIKICNKITLHLIFYPLDKALKEIALNDSQKIDAWFLDGFAPSKNPTMWHKGLWHFMALRAINTINQNTSVATFTAASEVRKMLQHYGFEVSKRKGFGYKREMVTATFNEKQLSTPKPNLASDYCNSSSRPQKVAIIGAGLAGTSLAYRLNQNDIEVHLFEQSSNIAAAASKMPALLATPNFSIDHNSYSQLTFAGLKLLQSFLNENEKLINADKALQFTSEKYSQYQLEKYLSIYEQRATIKSHSFEEQYALEVPAFQVNGPAICNAFIKQMPTNQIHLNSKISDIKELREFDHIALATGYHNLNFLTQKPLPSVMPLRGQVTCIKAPKSLEYPLNYDHHLFQHKSHWVLGATFENSDNDSLRANDDDSNIANANKKFDFKLDLKHQVKSYAGVRASSFDRFPYCGLFETKKGQSLWLNYGYGTRGLCLSLLGAEVISRSMLNQTLPIQKSLLQKLNPLR